jgi:hypothetical protein
MKPASSTMPVLKQVVDLIPGCLIPKLVRKHEQQPCSKATRYHTYAIDLSRRRGVPILWMARTGA